MLSAESSYDSHYPESSCCLLVRPNHDRAQGTHAYFFLLPLERVSEAIWFNVVQVEVMAGIKMIPHRYVGAKASMVFEVGRSTFVAVAIP